MGGHRPAEAAATLAERDPEQARVQIRRLQDLTRDATEQLRSLIFELRPAELEADGLVPTLRKHVDVLRRVYPVDLHLGVEGERRLEAGIEKELFRIAQEALFNALKHANASEIRLTLDMLDSRVELTVRDDGVGFDAAESSTRPSRLGLTSMHERAEAVGGRLSIDSSPGMGTTVRLEAPIDG